MRKILNRLPTAVVLLLALGTMTIVYFAIAYVRGGTSVAAEFPRELVITEDQTSKVVFQETKNGITTTVSTGPSFNEITFTFENQRGEVRTNSLTVTRHQIHTIKFGMLFNSQMREYLSYIEEKNDVKTIRLVLRGP